MATEFVHVRNDEDGREADITKEEVEQYREMGFVPVDTSEASDAEPNGGETIRLREPTAQTEPAARAADAKATDKK